MSRLTMDKRLETKVALLMCYVGEEAYSIRFIDIDETFWFDSFVELQGFVLQHERERFHDRELRKGYFLYTNEHGETFKYSVTSHYGMLTVTDVAYVE